MFLNSSGFLLFSTPYFNSATVISEIKQLRSPASAIFLSNSNCPFYKVNTNIRVNQIFFESVSILRLNTLDALIKKGSTLYPIVENATVNRE